jgi:sialate O-acetylesterase
MIPFKKTIYRHAGLAAILFIGHFASTDVVRVACVGDSITFGYGLQQSYPAKLGHLLGTNYEVRNFGVSATTLLHCGDYPYIGRPAYTNALDFKADLAAAGSPLPFLF